jgi:hypothetical protein
MEKAASCLLEDAPAIPGFEVIEKLGSGGMGDVYLARQVSLDRTVAVKVLHPLPEGAGSAYRNQESRLMAALAHPHVVAIHDCGQADGRDYLIMEHVKGASLREHMKPGEPWKPAKALPILNAVADALAYIHSREILHLDLKPENVLLDEQGRAKITDFGLAVLDPRAHALATDGMGYGTLDYCSPEQRHGLPVDPRSDLFSLAALAYELLTGRLPARVYRPASKSQRGLAPAVDEVLRRGLERDPDARPKSVEEFRQTLVTALRPPRFSRRHVLLVGLVLIMAAASVAVVLPLYWSSWFASSSISTTRSVWEGRAWLVYHQPEELAWLGPLEGEFAEIAGKPIVVQGLRPDPDSGVLLPAWPSPGPVLVLSADEEQAFIHVGEDQSLAPKMVRTWSKLRELPALPPEDNYAASGLPNERRLLEESDPWRPIGRADWSEDYGVFVGCPPDRAEAPALCFVRRVDTAFGGDVAAYKWLARTPNREGTLMVIRYRARAEEGVGRLSVSLHLPLYVPKNDQGDLASRLRKLAVPHPVVPETAEEQVLDYAISDWVQPGSEWRTYYVLFRWPPLCKTGEHRNLIINYAGKGKVWVDQIEVFPWQIPSTPLALTFRSSALR